nr:nucleotidyl transferase AbiEii/AbiGii toxin family protein [Actinopolymorpha pittospori]
MEPLADDLLFFGGTALSRTILTDGRLSEDIDLMTSRHRDHVAEAVEHRLVQGVRREFPGLRWQPPLRAVPNAQPAVLIAPDGLTVRIQLVGSGGYPPWPTLRRSLLQRYADAPPVALTVPTPASFAAWKTTAWNDRRVSRDLYDLWSLAGIGAINAEAACLFARYGPTGKPPTPHMFDQPPSEQTWHRDLSGQTRLTITAAHALTVVRDTWAAVTDDPAS